MKSQKKKVQQRVLQKALKEGLVPKHSSEKVRVIPKLLIVVSVLLLLLVLAFVYKITSVGKAIYDVPVEDVVNLNKEELVEFNLINDVTEWLVNITGTNYSTKKMYNLKMKVTLDEENVVSYVIMNNIETETFAKGLLWGSASPTAIYLDDDTIADFEISYDDPYFNVLNTHYVAPSSAVVDLYQIVGSEKDLIASSVVPFLKGQAAIFLLNVSSTKLPSVNVTWQNGSVLSSELLNELPQGENYRMFNLTLAFSQDGVHVLVVHADVDGVLTTKKYVLAVGNVLYALQEESYPSVLIKKVSNGYSFTVGFNVTSLHQAFSLPCGIVDLDTHAFAANVSTVYAYDQDVDQWKKGVPSEFGTLVYGKGYIVALKENMNVTVIANTTLKGDCIIPMGLPPEQQFELPSLQGGWNLIGVPDYTTVLVNDLEKKAGAGKKIAKVYSMSNDGAVLVYGKDEKNVMIQGNELQPGKAYWVKVE